MKLLFLQENPMYEALGLHALGGMVKAAGHECDVLIESEEKDFMNSVAQAKPDLIAFSFMTRQQEWAIHTTNRINKELRTPVLIGGTHPTMYPETLGHCAADYLCVGEGEGPLVDLLNRMRDGYPTDTIPNIHAKVNGQIVQNPIRTLMHDWDTIPTPDRSVYHRYPFLGKLPLKRFITSFGCAYKCSFCYINNYRDAYKGKGKFYRRKSYERVVREMKEVRGQYPFTRIHYVDDIFSLDRKWLEGFLPVYKREIGLPWTANIWIAHMDETLVRFFKEHGCAGLTFGVESGDEKTRRGMLEKELSDAVYIKHCRHLKDYDIPFHTGNIIGLPGQGVEEAFQTARFNRKIGTKTARAGLFWPFPGTRLTDYAMEIGVLDANYSIEYFNRGIYPKVEHKEVEELTVLSNLFQLVAKWSWFETLARFLLRWPRSPIVKWLAKVGDQFFWWHEARFFGVMNLGGLRYYLHLRRALVAMRRHGADPRFKNDAEAQSPFWNISEEDVKRVSDGTRDGLT